MKKEFPLLDACDPSTCSSGKMMRLDRIVSTIYRKHISPFDLTNSQLSMLFVITKVDKISQHNLCTILYLEKSSVCRNIRRLINIGLIDKVNSKQLTVTKKGKSILEKLIPAWGKANEEVKALLGTDGQEAFNTVYKKLAI